MKQITKLKLSIGDIKMDNESNDPLIHSINPNDIV